LPFHGGKKNTHTLAAIKRLFMAVFCLPVLSIGMTSRPMDWYCDFVKEDEIDQEIAVL